MDWIPYITLFLLSTLAYFKTNLKSRDILIVTSILFLSLLSWESALAVIFLTTITFYFQSKKTLAWIAIIAHLVGLVSVNLLNNDWNVFKVGLIYYSLQNIGILLLSIRHKPQTYSFKELLFANVFFPKLLCGPILLPKEISQLKPEGQFNSTNLYYAINRIVYGVFKKVVLADNISLITDTVFNHPESEFKGITITIAALLFTLEMYLNFSAYTDIALGFARLFNIKLKENFNIPLRSKSISEYWRKTHISLIDWFTQNFFYYFTFKLRSFPIVGSLIGILATFILSGIWHGLFVGFLIWGLLNGFYLAIEYLGKRKEIKLPQPIGWALTIILVSFSNIFFVSKLWTNSMHFIKQLFSLDNWSFDWDTQVIAILGNGGYLEQRFQLTMILSLAFLFLIFEKRLEKYAKSKSISILFISSLVILCFLVGNLNDGADFIYMQF